MRKEAELKADAHYRFGSPSAATSGEADAIFMFIYTTSYILVVSSAHSTVRREVKELLRDASVIKPRPREDLAKRAKRTENSFFVCFFTLRSQHGESY